jgi:hypothetical protein
MIGSLRQRILQKTITGAGGAQQSQNTGDHGLIAASFAGNKILLLMGIHLGGGVKEGAHPLLLAYIHCYLQGILSDQLTPL